MQLRLFAAACAALVSMSATAAFAADPVNVKLQQPVPERVKFIAGGAVFVCEADACLARATVSSTYSVDTCKAVAAKVGAVTSFGDRRSFDSARLATCNGTAQVAKAATAPDKQ